jgi:benzil reductase ((S)-benzoin forming)
MRRWAIITGQSRGMGEALAAQCLAEGMSVLGISRNVSELLQQQQQGREAAAGSGGGIALLEQWQCDLSDGGGVAADRLSAWLGALDPSVVESLVLINNAALLSAVQPLHTVPAQQLSAALRVGLEAPVLLTRAFLAATHSWVSGSGASPAAWGGQRRVLQISSGLGRFAMASVGSYCAIKAGLDNFSASVALDQQQLGPAGAKIVSLAPGVIATDMQAQLRAADAAGFPDKDKFLGMHASGALDTPAQAAAKVMAFLARDDFGRTVIADVRQT